MLLFDEIVRTEVRFRLENEGAFDYMNASARRGIVAVRGLLEAWFAEFPEEFANDLRSRFRSSTAVDHQGAFWELYLHTLLRRMGYEVRVHPAMLTGVSAHPDFQASGAANRTFYLEATQATAPRTDVAAARRIDALYDALNRMYSPNFFLEVQLRGHTEMNIPVARLRERLERWLSTLDVSEIEENYRAATYDALPQFTWTFDDLQLTFTPMPKSLETRGREGVRPIAAQMPEGFRIINVHEDIRAAVEGKAEKYGNPTYPVVIAVNVDEDFCELYDVANALFGDEYTAEQRAVDGSWQQSRRRLNNGALYGRHGARNRTVSAVVVTRRMTPTTLRSQDLHVVHNPYAAVPLPSEWLPLPQFVQDMDKGQLELRAGTCAADILGVPAQWPIPD